MKRGFDNQDIVHLLCARYCVRCVMLFNRHKDMQSGHNYPNSVNEENEALRAEMLFFRSYN